MAWYLQYCLERETDEPYDYRTRIVGPFSSRDAALRYLLTGKQPDYYGLMKWSLAYWAEDCVVYHAPAPLPDANYNACIYGEKFVA